MTGDVTVIIPTFDRWDALGQCLTAVSAQSASARIAEVIVVDDGSPTRPPEGLGEGLPLTVLTQPNKGPAAARNRALARARGDLVWILNDDAVPAPGCLAALLAYRDAVPGCGSVLGRFDLLDSLMTTPFMRMVAEGTMLFAYDLMEHGRSYDWQFFWTCNILVDRAAIDRVGRFDETTFGTLWGAEDAELGYRLKRDLGIRTHYCATAACGHDHVVTLDQFMRKRFMLGRNLYRMYRRHDLPRAIYMPDGFSYGATTHARVAARVAARRAAADVALDRLTRIFARPAFPAGTEAATLPALRCLVQTLGQERLNDGILSEAAGTYGEPEPGAASVGPDRRFDIHVAALLRMIEQRLGAAAPRLVLGPLPRRPLTVDLDRPTAQPAFAI